MTFNWIISFGQTSEIDSTILRTDTARIQGELYTVIFRTDEFLYIQDSNNKIVFKTKDYYPDFEFIDFDNDGNKDLMINYMSNVPAIKDLIVFDSKTKSFKAIESFSSYPAAKPLNGTKYYFSYHRSGCADMNWDSDLFFIENYKTIKIGNISGRECDDRDEKDGIYIYKVQGESKKLIKTQPIDIISKYKDYKWGFILDYWTKNYKIFERVKNKLLVKRNKKHRAGSANFKRNNN